MPLPPPPPPSRFSLSRLFGAPAPTAHAGLDDEAAVEQLRTQARRRLIGAVVLLAVGVVAFPLVFETEPRPMGVDTPMQRVPDSRAAAGQVAHAPTSDPSTLSPSARTPSTAPAAPAPTGQAAAPEPVAEPGPAPAPAPAPAPDKPTVAAPVVQPVTPPAPAPAPPAEPTEAQRARALLEGRTPASPAPTPAETVVAARFVVQVGAYSEVRTIRDVRARVEALGLKTYTQVVNSPAGARTRVRVGPFDSRDDAEAASAKLRAAGLPGAILTL